MYNNNNIRNFYCGYNQLEFGQKFPGLFLRFPQKLNALLVDKLPIIPDELFILFNHFWRSEGEGIQTLWLQYTHYKVTFSSI